MKQNITSLLKIVFVFLATISPSASQHIVAAEYVGNEYCQDCHTLEFQQWQGSDHDRSMQLASPTSVLGNFSDVTVNFHGVESRFYTSDGDYFVETSGEDGHTKSFQIAYTFGHDPLQQYLIELNDGHIQALNIAWDSRPVDQGGQRWFHLRPDENINPDHPFFWTNHFQNWNSRCAECHSTGVQRNYSAENSSYDTSWSEINVSCEGCHGPAGDHVNLAHNGKLASESNGLVADLADKSNFVFVADDDIANNDGDRSSEQLNTCAVCHSRRGVVGGYEANQDYHEQFQLTLLNTEAYHADGQINDEVFVFGSFLQSKMHAAGVTCTNCHNAHTAELKAPANTLCQTCHQTETYQNTAHHKHLQASTGAQCTSCHMPEKTYMRVDDRADHSFSIPRPVLANRVGAPNACSSCHVDWQFEQLVLAYRELFGEEPESFWSEANYEGRRLNLLALNEILRVANDESVSPIQRASLLAQSANFPARSTVDSIQANLGDTDPLVRRAAVEASVFIPPSGRLQLLQPLIDDEIKTVRLAVANQLADAFLAAPDSMRPGLLQLFEEYEESLALNENSPGGQVSLGSYYYRRGNVLAAERAYLRALEIEPAFVPSLLNLADWRREQGNEAGAESYLLRALLAAPDSAAVNHSLGLLRVRQGNIDDALAYLQSAITLADTTPRYAYVYAVALDSVNRRQDAIEVLKQSEQQWPNQPDSLLLLVSYLDQEGEYRELLPYLSNLSRLLPGDPNVGALVNKYSISR